MRSLLTEDLSRYSSDHLRAMVRRLNHTIRVRQGEADEVSKRITAGSKQWNHAPGKGRATSGETRNALGSDA